MRWGLALARCLESILGVRDDSQSKAIILSLQTWRLYNKPVIFFQLYFVMAKRQVSANGQRGARASSFHRISTFYSKVSDGRSLILCAEKQTTSTRKTKSCEVRRSARLKESSQSKDRSRRKQQETGLSLTGEASRDQAVGIFLVLLTTY